MLCSLPVMERFPHCMIGASKSLSISLEWMNEHDTSFLEIANKYGAFWCTCRIGSTSASSDVEPFLGSQRNAQPGESIQLECTLGWTVFSSPSFTLKWQQQMSILDVDPLTSSGSPFIPNLSPSTGLTTALLSQLMNNVVRFVCLRICWQIRKHL